MLKLRLLSELLGINWKGDVHSRTLDYTFCSLFFIAYYLVHIPARKGKEIQSVRATRIHVGTVCFCKPQFCCLLSTSCQLFLFCCQSCVSCALCSPVLAFCPLLLEFFVLDFGILCLDMFWEAQKIKLGRCQVKITIWLKIPVLRSRGCHKILAKISFFVTKNTAENYLEVSLKIQLFHTYKCWHAVSDSGHWLGSLLTCYSTSWYDSQVINISDEMYVHSL